MAGTENPGAARDQARRRVANITMGLAAASIAGVGLVATGAAHQASQGSATDATSLTTDTAADSPTAGISAPTDDGSPTGERDDGVASTTPQLQQPAAPPQQRSTGTHTTSGAS